MPDQFRFDSQFQDLVLASYIRHPSEFRRYGDTLKGSYFEGVHSTIVANAVFKHAEEHGRTPGWNLVRQLTVDEASRLNLGSVEAALDYVEKLRDVDTGDYEYVVSRVCDFARERALVSAIKKAVVKLQDNEVPEDGFVSLFQEAMKVGQDLTDMGILLNRDVEAVIDQVTSHQYGTKTGYAEWDRLWYHGWGPGWLVVLLAPPKRYKTAVAINLALNITSASQGQDVIYYPCEISQELAALRAFQKITGTPLRDIYEAPNRFKDTVRASITNGALTGQFLMKGYAANAVTLTTIRNHAVAAKEAFKLNLGAIVIDYADTVRPGGSYDREDLAQKAIYEQARAIGHELGCPVIMPDRVTKEATEQQTPDMRSFQGAFAKGGVVDVAIGLCATEQEYAQNILRTFVFLNRHGAAGLHCRGKVDPEIMAVDVGEEIEWSESDAKALEEERPRRRRGRSLPPDLEDGP